MEPIAEHLGDGAYVTYDGREFIFTANHHDPNQATDKVYLDPTAYQNLLQFFERIEAIQKTDGKVPNLGDPEAALKAFIADPNKIGLNKVKCECKKCHDIFLTCDEESELCDKCLKLRIDDLMKQIKQKLKADRLMSIAELAKILNVSSQFIHYCLSPR